VRFFGTIKNTTQYPFDIDAINKAPVRTSQGRVVTPASGQRTSFIATQRAQHLKAVVMRHGIGKSRAARLITNSPMFQENAWVCEIKHGSAADGEIKRLAHGGPPAQVPDGANVDAVIECAFTGLLSTVWQMTLAQRTADWFLTRLFCFSSTTFHVALNCASAVYFRSPEERALHDDCKAIVGLRPTKHITIANAATLEDGDVPRQRGAQANQQTTLQTNTTLGTRGAEVRGDKTSPVYWLNGRTKAVLQNLVDELGLEVPAGAKRKDLGEALASFHGSLAGAPVAPLQAEVATPDDAGALTAAAPVAPLLPVTAAATARDAPAVTAAATPHDAPADTEAATPGEAPAVLEVAHADVDDNAARVAFLQRMMPHWFMRPFQAGPEGAIYQGIKNESYVIEALPAALKKFSKGKYKARDVREFGLLVRRDLPSCASSPDGVLAIMKLREDGTYAFVSLAVLEIKTRGAEQTAAELDKHVAQAGTPFEECDAGTDAFRSAVPTLPWDVLTGALFTASISNGY